VEVAEREPGVYVVLYSPGLVEGIAAGDVIRLTDAAFGHFEVLERSGNVSVKWGARSELGSKLNEADSLLQPLGARRDGAIERAAVWTIPVSTGFEAIEAAMEAVVSLISGSSWLYGNVYDENEKPLNWW